MNQTALQVSVLRLICVGLALGFGAAGLLAAFEPEWTRAVALGTSAFCIVLTFALPRLRARGPGIVRGAIVLLMCAVLVVTYFITPVPFPSLGAFVFLGIAVGIASYERFVPGVILATIAVAFGVIAIYRVSTIFFVLASVFLIVALACLYAVFGFRRVAAGLTAAAIEESTRDPLTGMGNRRGMASGVAALAEQASESAARVGCLILDLDHFKTINDNYGHATGDEVLVAAARQMTQAARRSDLFIRLGGEEFALFTVVADAKELELIAERLRAAIETLEVTPRITASVGGALQRAAGEVEVDTLLRDADRQLYRAKDAGRNAVRVTGA